MDEIDEVVFHVWLRGYQAGNYAALYRSNQNTEWEKFKHRWDEAYELAIEKRNKEIDGRRNDAGPSGATKTTYTGENYANYTYTKTID